MQQHQSSVWRRLAYALSFVLVAGVAGTVSYSHIRDVALYGHQSNLIAHLIPLSVDGMMLIATLAMAEDKAANRYPRGWARSGFWFGAIVSMVANVSATVVAHGWEPIAVGISGLAPVLLLWAIEIVARPGKPREETPVAPQVTAEMSELESPNLPTAPVSPAPVGRPKIPAVMGPDGRMVEATTGEPLKPRTERKKRNGK